MTKWAYTVNILTFVWCISSMCSYYTCNFEKIFQPESKSKEIYGNKGINQIAGLFDKQYPEKESVDHSILISAMEYTFMKGRD